MFPNTLKIFQALGIQDSFFLKAQVFERMVFFDHAGKPVRDLDMKAHLASEQGLHSIRRSELQRLIWTEMKEYVEKAEVELILDDGFDSFEEFDDKIVVRTQKGSSIEADVLIGADGIHSRVRNFALRTWGITDSPSTRSSGVTAWWAVLDLKALEESKEKKDFNE